MSGSNRTRRSYGTGSILTRNGAYYGKWRVGGRQVKRKLGRVRMPGTRVGLTRAQAEARLRDLIVQTTVVVSADERRSFAEVGEQYATHLEVVMGRKPTTVQDYRIILRRHLGPFYGARSIDRLNADDVTAYMATKRRDGLGGQTIRNHVTFAHGVFVFAMKRGLCSSNPVAQCDRPQSQGADPDIRHLSREDIGALLHAVPDDDLGRTDHVVYLVAAMAGLRQGELIALRWRDVDWTAGVIRVRRSYSRGQFTTPKSKHGSRAVPMADTLAAELDRHFQASAFQHDDDLAMCHPTTGGPYDPSKMRKRFKAALTRAGVRAVRFHDLRHTYGTQMAAAGAPLRTLQGWMGHRDYKTTEVYAAFAPDDSQGRDLAERAFGGNSAPSGQAVASESHVH